MPRLVRVVAAGLAASLLLGACIGGSDPPSRESETEWERVGPEKAGFDPAPLADVVEHARANGSTCFMTVRDDQIATEAYWRGGAHDKPVHAFSVTKSVASTLVGIAQGEGLLDIDDPASRFIEKWQGTPSEAVTIRNLLSNDSGRAWEQRADLRDLEAAPDRTAHAVGLDQVAPPGTAWRYNNSAIQALDRVLAEATGTDTASFAKERLFEPLGMENTRMTRDKSGRSTNMSFGLESTCPDLARFGMLFAQGGAWDGEQVVPADWVQEATAEASQALNPTYGLLWWLVPPAAGQPVGPDPMYAAVGFGGQIVLVDPASETAVVRLGWSATYTALDAARVVTEALRPAR